MSRKFLIGLAVATFVAISSQTVQAYPSEAMFGGGYSGVRHIQNQAQYEEAVNDYSNKIDETLKQESEKIEKAEKNVSNVIRDKDGKYDYNPYTGSDAGVNESKSIYTDDLGRLHFFGKAHRFRDSK